MIPALQASSAMTRTAAYKDIEDANDINADDERNRAQEARLARLEREMEQARSET